MKITLVPVVLFFVCSTYVFAQELQNAERLARASRFVMDAQLLIEDEKYNQAIVALKAAIAIDSTNRDAYLFLYKSCLRADSAATAIPYLKKAKHYFGDHEVIFFLGKTYQTLKQYDKALAEYHVAIQKSKQQAIKDGFIPYYYANRGICYLKMNKYAEAVKDFDEALKLDDAIASAYANRGVALFQLKRYKEACDSWNMALGWGEESVVKYIEKNCK